MKKTLALGILGMVLGQAIVQLLPSLFNSTLSGCKDELCLAELGWVQVLSSVGSIIFFVGLAAFLYGIIKLLLEARRVK